MKAHLLTTVLCALALVFAACSNSTSGNPTNPALYTLGETGPGGGMIFYVSKEGFTVYRSASDTRGITAHYLEAAPADIGGTMTWASPAALVPPDWLDISGTADGIGSGRKNTALILAADPDAPSAKACAAANYGGKTDWFLPSRDELKQLCDWKRANSFGGFEKAFYWTSSQYNDIRGKVIYFDTGKKTEMSKDDSYPVRAIRAF